jgi:acyl-CoA reductase-like NAD-dependent aldehyde dehydrogenase
MAAVPSLDRAIVGIKTRATIDFLRDSPKKLRLAAAVWTQDVSRAFRVARALKAGTVWINCYNNIDPISPFGGYKQSGIGRELGKHSIDLYTQIKSVYVKL